MSVTAMPSKSFRTNKARMDDIIAKLLLKLNARDTLDEAEIAALRRAIGPTKTLKADEVFIRQGEELSVSTLLVEGLVCRFKDLRDGGRQISAIHVAGDFVDLHSFSLKRLDHNIMTLTPCRVAFTPHDRLREITEQHPHLTRLLWFLTNVDAAMHREWELSLGRRDAIRRTAHLFCEIGTRLEVVHLAQNDSYDLPLTQQELAECLGLTPVHVNRTLKELRERGLVTFRDNRVTITDRRGLETVAEFDPAYLYLERRAR